MDAIEDSRCFIADANDNRVRLPGRTVTSEPGELSPTAAIDAVARVVPHGDPLAVMVESVFVGGPSVGSWPHVVRLAGRVRAGEPRPAAYPL